MTSVLSASVKDVDFTAPGAVDPADFGLDALTGAAARVSVDLSPTTGLGASRLGRISRVDGTAASASGRSWFHLRTARGHGVLLVDHSLAVVVSDLLMGGTGAVEPRPLTSVEERVLVPHLQRAMSALSGAFQPSGLGALEVLDPGRGPVGLRGDMFAVEIVVDLGASETGSGSLVLFVPAPESQRRSRGHDGSGAREAMSSGALLDVPLPLAVHTGVTMLPASRVSGFSVGDVLELRHRCDAPLRVLVGDVDVAAGLLGRHESSLTVQVVSGTPSVQFPSSRPSRSRRVVPVVFRAAAAPVQPPSFEVESGDAALPASSEDSGQSVPESMLRALDELKDLAKGESDVNVDESVVAQAVAATEDALVVGAPAVSDESQMPLSLGVLADVPVEVSVEVGRAQVSLRDAVALAPGQVVTLDAESDSPASVLVNGRLVARGQVVVVDNVYGVRISELVEE